MRGGGARYALGSSALALGAGAVCSPLAFAEGAAALRAYLAGWAVVAVIGVSCGAWMVAVHGRPGAGFLAALGTSMLGRFAAVAAAAALPWLGQAQALWPYVGGLLVGYVPLQLFEILWFLRKSWSRAEDRDALLALCTGRGRAER